MSQHYQQQRSLFSLNGRGGRPLRPAQRGAVGAVIGHFSMEKEPAIVSLPTGVGKTLVAACLPYVLDDVKRVLVLVPSRVLRGQLHSLLSSGELLSKAGLLPENSPRPAVLEMQARTTDWSELLPYDLVVATPGTVSPAHYAGNMPPEDLFDLIIVDEGHHVPATTWSLVVQHFSSAKHVFLTATPFRRDGESVPGDVVYHYPLEKAVQDGSYLAAQFVPVAPSAGEAEDEAIARAAVAHLSTLDESVGLLVRAGSINKANELKGLYGGLGVDLVVVHSKLTASVVEARLAGLSKGEHKGAVFVGVLGEGFDCPRLKVGAYHDPHQSLPATLQFIGRLSRTWASQPAVDPAVVAITGQMRTDTWELYQSDAVWSAILPHLVQSQVDKEVDLKKLAASFEGNLHDLSVREIWPKRQAEVFEWPADPQGAPPWRPHLLEEGTRLLQYSVVAGAASKDNLLALYVLEEKLHAGWDRKGVLDSVGYSLVVVAGDRGGVLGESYLFVEAPSSAVARAVVASITGVPKPELKLASPAAMLGFLAGQQYAEYSSIGLRRTTAPGRGSAVYRMVSGRNVDWETSRANHRGWGFGHVMGTTKSGGLTQRVGMSTKTSKVWAGGHTSLSSYRAWVTQSASAMRMRLTGSQVPLLGDLNYPEALTSWPKAPLLAVELPTAAWNRELLVNKQRLQEMELTSSSVGHQLAGVTDVKLVDQNGTAVWQGRLEPGKAVVTNGTDPAVADATNMSRKESLSTVFTRDAPRLRFADGSITEGALLYRLPAAGVAPADLNKSLRRASWTGVAIQAETRRSRRISSNQSTVIEYVSRRLTWSWPDAWVMEDDGSGELADLVLLRPRPDGSADLALVHCKASSNPQPGVRVADLYEVLGQVAKSLRWAGGGPQLWEELLQRSSGTGRFRAVSTGRRDKVSLHAQAQSWVNTPPLLNSVLIVAAQPGVRIGNAQSRASTLSPGAVNLLSSTQDWCASAGAGFLFLGNH
jgi:superfamily II DNA or RNA helicase